MEVPEGESLAAPGSETSTVGRPEVEQADDTGERLSARGSSSLGQPRTGQHGNVAACHANRLSEQGDRLTDGNRPLLADQLLWQTAQLQLLLRNLRLLAADGSFHTGTTDVGCGRPPFCGRWSPTRTSWRTRPGSPRLLPGSPSRPGSPTACWSSKSKATVREVRPSRQESIRERVGPLRQPAADRDAGRFGRAHPSPDRRLPGAHRASSRRRGQMSEPPVG